MLAFPLAADCTWSVAAETLVIVPFTPLAMAPCPPGEAAGAAVPAEQPASVSPSRASEVSATERAGMTFLPAKSTHTAPDGTVGVRWEHCDLAVNEGRRGLREAPGPVVMDP